MTPSLVAWPFQKNSWQTSWRQPFPRVPSQHPPTPPLREVAMKGVTLAEEAAAEEPDPIGEPVEDPITSQTPSKGPTWREPLPNWFPGWGGCYIPPGQSLLLGRSLWSPEVPNGDLIARVLGEGWPSTNGWRNSCRFKIQGQNPHCQLGHWKLHGQWHHP